MKLKEGFIITKNGNDYIAVAAGEAGKAFNGMIKMNGTAGFIATLLAESDTTAEKVTDGKAPNVPPEHTIKKGANACGNEG